MLKDLVTELQEGGEGGPISAFVYYVELGQRVYMSIMTDESIYPYNYQ